MLKVKLLHPDAKAPVVAHPGEDCGYDLYAAEAVTLFGAGECAATRVRTGVAVEARHPHTGEPLALLLRDRSSMAAKRLVVTGGVIDAGYRGEIIVMLTNLGATPYHIEAGSKIAQMIPLPVLTGAVETVAQLGASSRNEGAFGSTGQ